MWFLKVWFSYPFLHFQDCSFLFPYTNNKHFQAGKKEQPGVHVGQGAAAKARWPGGGYSGPLFCVDKRHGAGLVFFYETPLRTQPADGHAAAMKRILVTGATGQIGSELTPLLRQRYGANQVVAAGHRAKPVTALQAAGPLVFLDVRDRAAIAEVVRQYEIDTVYHLAALLSAMAEADPPRAWEINMQGLVNVLEVARQYHCAVFFPSSIAAFGPDAPRLHTPQHSSQRPRTIYGVTKVAGELLCDYYHQHFGVDTRGLRFPGLISHVAKPGGGTTDYAVEIFYAASEGRPFRCPLRSDTALAMMYMADALRAAIELMEADPSRLTDRNAFNVAALSFTPAEIGAAIAEQVPGFTMTYEIDPLRQSIAEGWPASLDDSAARQQWGWRPAYDLTATVREMLARLAARRSGGREE